MLDRLSNTIVTVTVGTTAAASEEIRYGGYAGGMTCIPAGSNITTLTWYVAEKFGGTYLPAYDEDGWLVEQEVVHTRAYALPLALFGARAIKAVGNVDGEISVTMKG